MKIKTRLMVSFAVMIILPITLMGILLYGIVHIRSAALREAYGISEDGKWISDSTFAIDEDTRQIYNEILEQASADGSGLLNKGYLEELNGRLAGGSSFLLLRSGGEILYNGSADPEEQARNWESILPSYGSSIANDVDTFAYSRAANIVIRQIDFELSAGSDPGSGTDGGTGSLFLLTAGVGKTTEFFDGRAAQWITLIVVALAITALIMTVWLYRSMMRPIRKLQTAAKNIQHGNLDFTIDYDGKDEIGELCRNFEDMRVRLKESTEEKINSEKENQVLISNIAHDLKTPITAVKGYAEGLIDGVADTPEKQDRYLRTIYSKANEMDRLINELTTYSKLDTNRIPYSFQKINLADYFGDCVEEIGLDLEEKNIRLNYSNYAANDTIIIADPEQLMRVVNNIVSNAVKYMDKENGTINFRIRDVGDFVQMEIEDNGKGIGSHDLPHIFDRFYRTDSARNSSTGGSGIGLSIVKKIIEDHGGQIWATSKEHVGTTIYFVLRKYQEVIHE